MSGRSRAPWGTYLILTGVAFIWGTNFVATKIMLNYLPPLTLQLMRIPVGVLIMGVAAWRAGALEPLTRKMLPAALIAGVSYIAINNNLFLTGVKYTSPANASLVLALSPLATALIASRMAGEPLRATQWLGLALSFSGVAALILMGSSASMSQLHLNPGDIIMLGAMLSNSMYTLGLRRVMAFTNPLSGIFWSSLLGGLVAIPINYYGAELTPTRPLDTLFWSLMAYSIIFSAALGSIWWTQGIQRIGAARTSIFLNAVPLFSGLAAVVFLNEPITVAHLIGMVLIVVGVRLGTAPPEGKEELAAAD